MIATERIQEEEHFHDLQAAERAEHFERHRDDLVFNDNAYLDHETWIRPAFSQLGDVRGRDVLDYGCGHGMASVVLARQGASVTAFDLSSGYVAEAKQRARANSVEIRVQQADAEHLPFADNSFDAVWGSAILHHLDLHQAGKELRRVLRPGGVAVFCEPWAGNPLVNFARDWLPYPGKHRTHGERALKTRDLDPLRPFFTTIDIQGFQLLGMLRRLWSREPGPASRLDRWDQRLLKSLPFLKNACRYVVITLRG